MTVSLQALDRWLTLFRDAVTDQQAYLTELDSAIGDADHGSNLARGMGAVTEKLAAEPPAAADELLKKVGMTLVSSVGGASGPLYGTFFLRMAVAAGATTVLDAEGLGRALRAGVDGVVQRGKAEPGDKTMVDALVPAVDAYDAAVAGGGSDVEGLAAAVAAAEQGRDSVVDVVARKGRASYLGERSAGHLDPGSVSATMLLASLAEAVASS